MMLLRRQGILVGSGLVPKKFAPTVLASTKANSMKDLMGMFGKPIIRASIDAMNRALATRAALLHKTADSDTGLLASDNGAQLSSAQL